MLFHLGPTLTFEGWKQITLDEVTTSLEQLLKAFFFFFNLLHTYFVWFRIFEWLLHFLDLLANLLLDAIETHPFSSG